jgi:DNA-binding response OmpR family regulator
MYRVALAEDDRTMVRLLSTLLKLDGFEVHAIRDGEDIEGAVRRLSPNALILDMVMPNQNGLDVLDRIRRKRVGAHLYVLMISGIDAREVCLQHGADDFLLKPFVPEELTRKLRDQQPNFT